MQSAILMAVARVSRVPIGFAHSARDQEASARNGIARPTAAGPYSATLPRRGPRAALIMVGLCGTATRCREWRPLVLLVLLVLRTTTIFRCKSAHVNIREHSKNKPWRPPVATAR